jgi:hypothetical protein
MINTADLSEDERHANRAHQVRPGRLHDTVLGLLRSVRPEREQRSAIEIKLARL